MEKVNFEKMKKINQQLAAKGVNASTCNCSWRYDIHIAPREEKSPYEGQSKVTNF